MHALAYSMSVAINLLTTLLATCNPPSQNDNVGLAEKNRTFNSKPNSHYGTQILVLKIVSILSFSLLETSLDV